MTGRARHELALVLIALLAVAPLPCDRCGWPTKEDRRQLELDGVELDAETVCAQCTRRASARY